MEKLLVTNFSVFELHFNAEGHVFGAFVSSLLGMHHIQTNTQKLKIVLPWYFQVFIHVALYIYYTEYLFKIHHNVLL
jgi:hypothetical protein